MSVHVFSEIGPLKRVMLHRPGKELEHLVPDELERLLFDDIPYLKTAQAEHDAFAEMLRKNGVEVVYLEDLMAETLKAAPDLKQMFVEQFIREAGSRAQAWRSELEEYLLSFSSEKEMILKTMSGVRDSELGVRERRLLADLVYGENRFLLDPIPNLYFTRDPFAAIGRGVSLNKMYSATRARETIYGEYILHHHPVLADGLSFFYERTYPSRIEGGDILVLSPRVIAVGISQRTTPEAIERLSSRLFADPESHVEVVLAMDIPNLRATMHLDTVCTQVNSDQFLVHPGILGSLRVFRIMRGDVEGTLDVQEVHQALDRILAQELELPEVDLIKCGGNDRVVSEREQWNDGSNTLCISPGVVIAYDRNQVTNELLREHGIEVLEIPSSELSRGRGGPRCMSMPLERG